MGIASEWLMLVEVDVAIGVRMFGINLQCAAGDHRSEKVTLCLPFAEAM